MSQSSQCRWGILSTAAIAKKNWRAIAQSTQGTLVAVASRNKASAESFIDECERCCPQRQRPVAIEGYEALLDRNDIDAVYIPLPTGLRKDWIVAAAKKGKHILAEKPTAISTSDLESILAVCNENQVQFMDGVMFMHSQRMTQLRTALNEIGTLRRIASQFSFLGDDGFNQSNIRVDPMLEPFGCLGDLGWYCIRFILWANHWQMPSSLVGHCIRSSEAVQGATVPLDFSAELEFPNGSTASFFCSFTTGNQQWAHLSGTHGNLILNDFVLPHFGGEVGFDIEHPHFEVRGCDFHMHPRIERRAVHEYDSGFRTAQEINMIDRFNAIVLSKSLEPEWGKYSLATQQVMDQLLASSRAASRT
jgi:predicted dehydrogenase